MTDAACTSVGDLCAALRAALLFADDDDDDEGFPPLSVVYIEAGDSHLTVTATNRYVLGQASITATGRLSTGALVGISVAKLLADFLDDRMPSDPVHLTPVTSLLKQPRLRVEHLEGNFAIEMPAALVESTDSWVDYRKLLSKFDGASSTDGIASILLAPRIVGPIAKLDELYGHLPARWTFLGPLEPVRVEIGKAFTAVLMPIKPDTRSESFWPPPAAPTSAHEMPELADLPLYGAGQAADQG